MTEQIVQTLITMTISGTILALILFIIKPIINAHLPKSIQYYSWLLIVIAFLLPLSLFITLPEQTQSFAPHTVNEAVKQYIIPSDISWEANGNGDNTHSSLENEGTGQQAPSAQIISGLLVVWLTGSAIYLLYNMWSYITFARQLNRNRINASNMELALLAKLSRGKQKPALIKSNIAHTPMLVGIFKPTIVLPNMYYSESRLKYILLHELTHYRRRDIPLKWFVILANALHWFNPVIYKVRREIDKICELSCDETIIRNSSNDSKQEYGETLIAVASEKRSPRTALYTTMNEDKQVLKQRLYSIMTGKKITKQKMIVSAIFLAVTLCVVILSGASVNETNISWAKQLPTDSKARKPSNKTDTASGTHLENMAPDTTLDSTYEYFEEFPDIIDITKYLGVKPESMIMHNSSKDEMEFSFYPPKDAGQSKRSIDNYIELLESEGLDFEAQASINTTPYETMSLFFELQNSKYIVEIAYSFDKDDYIQIYDKIPDIDLVADDSLIHYQIKKIS